MTHSHFTAMARAELTAVFGGSAGRGALAVSLAIGIVSVAMMMWFSNNMTPGIEDTTTEQFIQLSGANCAGWALWARHQLLILPLLILLATGSCLAGEIQNHTIREALVRPVSRWSVIAAKLVALLSLSIVSLSLTLAPSFSLGCLFFGTQGPNIDLLLGYLASVGTDLGLICFGLLASTFVRSVGGVIVSVIMVIIVDTTARLLLWVTNQVQDFLVAAQGGTPSAASMDYALFLPGSSLDCWKGWNNAWAWEPFCGLTILVTLCITLTLVRFYRMDIP